MKPQLANERPAHCPVKDNETSLLTQHETQRQHSSPNAIYTLLPLITIEGHRDAS